MLKTKIISTEKKETIPNVTIHMQAMLNSIMNDEYNNMYRGVTFQNAGNNSVIEFSKEEELKGN